MFLCFSFLNLTVISKIISSPVSQIIGRMSLKDKKLCSRIDVYTYAFVAILGLALFLRFHELGQPYFWQTEIHHTWPAKNFLEGQGFSKPAGSHVPYLRSWFTTTLPIAISFTLLGYNEFAARLPTLIVGLFTIIVSYLLGKDIGGKKLGLTTSSIMAVSFWVINWHTQARMYAHNQFLYILSIWLVLRWYERDKLALKSNYLYSLVPTVLLGFHNHMTYLAMGPVIGVYFSLMLISKLDYTKWRSQIKQDELVRRNILWLIAFLFCGSIFMLVRGEGILVWLVDYAPAWYIWDRGPLYYLNYLSDNLIILYMFGFGLALSIRYRNNWLIPVSFLIPFVFQSLLRFKEPRLIFHLYPLYALIAAIPAVYVFNIIEDGLKSLNIDYQKINLAIVLLICLFVFSIYTPFQSLQQKDEAPHGFVVGSNHRAPANYIQDRMTEDDIIISSAPSITGWYLGSMDYVDYDLNYIEHRNESGHLIDPNTEIKAVKNSDRMEEIISNNTGWIVADSNFYTDFKIKNDVRQTIIQNSRKIENDSWENTDIYRFE
jgi:hypothetical protein